MKLLVDSHAIKSGVRLFHMSTYVNKVPHQLLLVKLGKNGIARKIFKWIEAWLSGRKQRVGIGDYLHLKLVNACCKLV